MTSGVGHLRDAQVAPSHTVPTEQRRCTAYSFLAQALRLSLMCL